MAGKVTGSVY